MPFRQIKTKTPWETLFDIKYETHEELLRELFVCKECGKECNSGRAVYDHALENHGVHVTCPSKPKPKTEIIAERDALAEKCKNLATENEELARKHDGLIADRDAFTRKIDSLTAECDELARKRDALVEERDILVSEPKKRRAALPSNTTTIVKATIDEAIQSTMDKLKPLCKDERGQHAKHGLLYEWHAERDGWYTENGGWYTEGGVSGTKEVISRLYLLIELGDHRACLPWCTIKQSTIKDAGNGLFAAKCFRKEDQLFCFFLLGNGTIISRFTRNPT